MKIFHLSTLLIIFSLLLAACTSTPPATPVATSPIATDVPPQPFRIAVIMPSAANDLAFSQSIFDALVRVQNEMGGPEKMTFVYSQGMSIIDDAAAAVRTYAAKDYDLVLAHGSQYGGFLQQVAVEYPGTSFAWGNGNTTFDLPNVFTYGAAAQEGGYVNGVLAASLSTSKSVGIVGPVEVGDAKLYIDGFKAGVLATNPEAILNVNYIGSFSDVVLAADAATSLISAGADVLTGSSQMVVGATSKAVESHVLWFGTQSNQSSLGPEIVVASQVYHWEGAIKQMIAGVQAGTLGGESFVINLANGGLVIEYNPAYVLPPEVKALADKTIQGIINGSITVPTP
jgi:basic membrane protein A